MKTRLRHINNRKGVSLVLLALAIVVLFGFAALAIDVGHLYNVKNQLQTAADASALAAVVKLSGNGTTQTNARNAAYDVGLENLADVAATDGVGGVNAGEPIPVTLDKNDNNSAAGDIVVGYWSSETGFIAGNNGPGGLINAVKVVARRTGAPNQPQVQNFFSKVFSIPSHLGIEFGADYSLANVAATAIASRGELDVLPIAVNEYWDEAVDKDGNPANNSGKAYGQRYPQSFMRAENAGTLPGVPDTARGGQTFAIIGTEANSNGNFDDINSFVNILYRFRHHLGYEEGLDPKKRYGYEVNRNSTTGDCSSGCGNNLSGPVEIVNIGDVNSVKFQDNFSFLFMGIPDNVIPPNAVREVIRVTDNPYIFNNYTAENGNDPSNCPHATIPYFSGSGSPPLNKKFSTDDPDFAYNGKRFWEVYPKGTKFMVMVYDGTIHEKDLVTVVGYGIIEIDGYKNGPWNGPPSQLMDRGGTAYGHAIPHGLVDGMGYADVSDPYIIQPIEDARAVGPNPYPLPDPQLPSSNQGICQFTDIIRRVQESSGYAKLVDPTLHYGTHTE